MGLIRLLLAMSVLVEHSAPLWGLHLVGGELAVQGFYAISGFYMAMILEGRYAGSPRRFWRNRFLRLFPVYWALLLPLVAVSLVRWTTSHGNHAAFLEPWRRHGGSLGTAAALLAALAVAGLVLQDLLFFLAADPATGAIRWTAHFRQVATPLQQFLPLPASWTLSLELAFYAMAPWLCRLRIRTLAAIALASLGLRLWLARQGLAEDPWSYRFLPTSLVFFLMGALAWKLGARIPRFLPTSARIGLWLAASATILLWPGRDLGSHSVAVVAAFAALLPAVFALSRDWPLDRHLGELSYPLYLCHFPVLALTPGLAEWMRAGSALLLACLVQATVGRTVERLRSRT
jgi:peptidoglycan/LPS O-acetylase OafA/YrhL